MPATGNTPSSPRLDLLRADLAGNPDAESVLAEFWQQLALTGTPIIEHISAEKSRALVTFVWRGDESTESVSLSELVSWRSPAERAFERIEGTDVWYLSWWFDLNVRTTYGFAVNQGEPGSRSNANASELIPDPLNRNVAFSDWERDELDSILEMPMAIPLPLAAEREYPLQGKIEECSFASDILQNDRPIWIYTPPGHSPNHAPYPFVVIFDGESFHSGLRVLDALIAEGAIPPMVAILVNQIGIRNLELTCNPEFSCAIATELVPWAREKWNLTNDPGLAALNGRSFGGLCSAYTALKHPDVFGNAYLQSASCWYHPSVMAATFPEHAYNQETVGIPASTPSIIDIYRNADAVPVRIYQECGNVENGPPPARVWQIFGNRWFHDVLTLKGYDTHYQEFSGGHDDSWWRGTFAEGIGWIFGNSHT